ncbi:MAG TPA: ribonuclease D [Thermoanaerobaculia bacterium]|nr:ribonuclease D [Thermoanaerobaculia bacterium]
MIWIDRQQPLDEALEKVAAQPVVAFDTEADSLHSYFDKVCLIQISAADKDLVIDPLAKVDLKRFGGILADPSITKILHGGDYDLRILNRDFGFTATNIIDTMICAQFLGYEAFGLGALLERHFGVTVNKAHQRADWAMRPLTPEMLQYAAMDTRYLIELAAKLRADLEAAGRWEWAQEEFARLEAVRYREVPGDEETWRKMKNIGNLDRLGLAIIRDLHKWRDHLAREADRPPFKIIGNDALLEIAKKRPETVADLAKLKPVAPYHRSRYGRELVDIVKRAMQIPESDLPERSEPKAWIRDKALEHRINRLKQVRDRIAAELKLDPGILAPRHVLTAIASSGSLEDIPAMREWQKQVLGDQLLTALQSPV